MRHLRSLTIAALIAALPVGADAAGCTTTITDQGKSDIAKGVHWFGNPYAVGQAYKIGEIISSDTAPVKIYKLTAAFTGTGLSVTAPTGTTTASDNGGTWTYLRSAPTYKFVLVKPGMSGTYGAATQFYSDVTGNSDEIAATGGYSSGGATLTGGTLAVASNHAQVDFADVVYSGATISAACGVVVNTSEGNRVVSVHDFGGTKTSSGADWTATIAAGVIAIN